MKGETMPYIPELEYKNIIKSIDCCMVGLNYALSVIEQNPVKGTIDLKLIKGAIELNESVRKNEVEQKRIPY
jgi:hypothetical protein